MTQLLIAIFTTTLLVAYSAQSSTNLISQDDYTIYSR